MRADTIRYRVSDAERAELEELRTWVGARTLSQVIRQGIEALKESSGFDLRNVEPLSIADGSASAAQHKLNEHMTEYLRIAQQDAGAGHALPAFVPGIVATEGDQ